MAAMNVNELIAELKDLGSESIKKIHLKHGAKEPFYGVKVEDMKLLMKKYKIKKDHQLAMDLYNSGVCDALYMAGLIADETKMTKEDLQNWVEKAPWYMVSEYTVPWVAAESEYGHELGIEWIESGKEHIASAGWATLSNLLALKPDEEIDKEEIRQLFDRIQKTIHKAQNRVKMAMNGFVIAAGGYVPDLAELAVETGKKIGIVSVDMEGTACKVPYSPEYIDKLQKRGVALKKKKTVRC